MRSSVAIIGVGVSKIEKSKPQRLEEIIFEASYAALTDAGVSRDEIDGVVTAACDEIDGRIISSMLTAAPAGAYLKDEIKVTDEGSYAVILGALRILSGVSNLVLVTSWSKSSDVPSLTNVTKMGAEPFFHRDVGITHIVATAIRACSYKEKFQVDEEAAASIVVKNRSNAVLNISAPLRKEVSLEEVLSSPMVAFPLRRLHIPPEADGACSLVLASKSKVRELGKTPIWLKGFGWSTEEYSVGQRMPGELVSLSQASKNAYKMAGISNPLKEIDVAEIHDISPYHELMAYEALGFCSKGEASKFLKAGEPYRDGSVPVNPSGGVLSGNPIFCGGLFRVVEAYLQLTGKAKNHQISNVRTALAHGTTALDGGQENAVFILEKEG
ncbi:MAG: thiolase family protein [Candidatus Baldrarchaeia archaeon]|nr:MAG: thiolase family protein [Candidatus Bathyarchaeota archaeon]